MDHSEQYVFFLYDGEWKIDNDGVCSFVSNSCDVVSVTQNTTYAELVDIIYNALGVDRLRYDLVLKVKYNMGMRNAPPAVIQNDRNVEMYLKVTSNTLQELRSPICVSLIDKSLHSNPMEEGKILGVVPDCDLFVNHAEEGELVRCDLVASTGLCPSPTPQEEPHVEMTSQRGKTSSHSDWPGSSYEPNQIESPDQLSVCGLEVSTSFDNKKELQLRLHKLAMATHFEFKVVKSTKDLWFVKCLDEKCKWRMRARKGKFSEKFEIRKLVKEHTCSTLTRQDARKTPSWVIGECIKRKYMDHHHDHMPKKIMEDMQTNFGLNLTYNKAWRSRKKALMAVRGTVEDWDIPESDVIKEGVCGKPPAKVKKGRPATKRRTSQGEPSKERRQCSSCGGLGHNRATCSAVMSAPAPCTAKQSQSNSTMASQSAVMSAPAPCTARQSQSNSTMASQSSVQHLA